MKHQSSCPLRFAALEIDATTGLYYNRARWYDPYLGRFISEDPIGIDGGINVYAYAGNDPVNWADPWGLSPCPANYYGCGNTFRLPGVTVSARPRGWWYTSMIDMSGGLRDLWSGGASIMAGMTVGTWHDDGSGPEVPSVNNEQEEQTSWKQCVMQANTSALAVASAAAGGAVRVAKPFLDEAANVLDDVARISRERFFRSGRGIHFRVGNIAARGSVLSRTGAAASGSAVKYMVAGALAFEVTAGIICGFDRSYYE